MATNVYVFGRGRPPLRSPHASRLRRYVTQQRRRAQTIYIKTAIDRWKEARGTMTDEKFALLLLDRNDAFQRQDLCQSTPNKANIESERMDIDMSDVSSISTGHFGADLQEEDQDKCSVSSMGLISPPEHELTLNTSFFSEECGAHHDSADETFCVEDEGELKSSLINPESIFDIGDIEEEEVEVQVKSASPDDVNAKTALCYLNNLKELAALKPETECQTKGCKSPVTVSSKMTGTAVTLKWTCELGHQGSQWTSQPVLERGMMLGNMQFCMATLLSGNNYAKISLFMKCLNMSSPSPSTFHRIQAKYIIPAVRDHWKSIQTAALEDLRGKKVVIAGDGRMDSPGHCAKYCTYTTIDCDSKKILDMRVVDKRETQLNSYVMENRAFSQSMEVLKAADVNVVEVVTDAHVQISSNLKKNFPEIKHSYDMWHGQKNLRKKLASIAHEKGASDLLPWISDITNHFWYCGEVCNGDLATFVMKWQSVLHHVVNVHQWAMGQCDHGELNQEETEKIKPWLLPGSIAHQKLQELVYNPYLMRSLIHYTNFRSNFELETLNNHILMYAGKRFAYGYDAFYARNLLAAIDYQFHIDRPLLINKEGETSHHRGHSKQTKHWRVWPQKVPKTYAYLWNIMEDIVRMYLESDVRVRGKVIYSNDHPKNISATIAPIPPPSTSEIVESQKSRFKLK